MCVGREWQWWEIGYIKGGDLIGKCVKGKEAQVFTAERELQVGGGEHGNQSCAAGLKLGVSVCTHGFPYCVQKIEM